MKRYNFFLLEKDMTNPSFDLGMGIDNGKEFKQVEKNYYINKEKVCKFIPSEQKRVRVVYMSKGCK